MTTFTGRRPRVLPKAPMARYVGRRLLQAVLVVWAAFTLSFVILWWLPGDAVYSKLASGGESSTVTPEQVAELRQQYGLDEPLFRQYLDKLSDALHGDLGTSVRTGQSVDSLIADAAPQTFQLIGLAFLIALVLGGSIALAATYSRRRWLRQTLASLPPIGVSLPTFWVGLMLIYFFSFQIQIFPASGNEGLSSLVLPAVTLALPVAAVIAQILAQGMGKALRQPYAEIARAKGATRRRVHLRHALPNASLPVVTVTALLLSNVLAGSAVIETVFARTGLGRLTVESVETQDVPVVQGVVVVSAVLFVVANLVVDLLYPVLDPRISLTGTEGKAGGA